MVRGKDVEKIIARWRRYLGREDDYVWPRKQLFGWVRRGWRMAVVLLLLVGDGGGMVVVWWWYGMVVRWYGGTVVW